MKKFIIAFFTLIAGFTYAQGGRVLKIGYIDMDYILEKSPDFAEAKNQLELKAGKWKQEMDAKNSEITKLREGLQAEKALLTKELIEEREEEIQFLEKDLSDYQQKKFGPNGELITQKATLVKPIQDQVFTIVQDIAENRKYDFIFDKSSDMTMLFAARKYDLSDLIVKRLSRAAKTEKMSSKERKVLEEQEMQDELEHDPDYAKRKELQDEKKAERERKLEERKAQKEQKKKENDEKKEQQKRERDAKRNGTPVPAQAPASSGNTPAGDDELPVEETQATAKEKPATTPAQDKAAEAKAERERRAEERKKEIEDRRKKLEEERERKKKEREEKNQKKEKPQTGTTEAPVNENDPQPAEGQ